MEDDSTNKLSVILPCRNQADHIGDVLLRYHSALKDLPIDYELIVVPNACSDNTVEVIQQIMLSDPRTKVISLQQGGWGRAVKAGLQAATGTILLYTNTARTEPEIIPAFVDLYLKKRPCLVKAKRENRQAPLRTLGSQLYNWESKLLFGFTCSDVNGTPKVFSRDFYQSILLSEDGDLIDLEVLIRMKRAKLKCLEIPLQGFKRHGGKSSTGWKSAVKMLSGAVRLRFQS